MNCLGVTIVVGVYGVMAFLVSQRTRKIGIRVALGATSRAVIQSVVLAGLGPVFIGMAIGSTAAAGLISGLRSIEGVADFVLHHEVGHPAVLGELALVFAITVLATVIPAKRALRVDTMATLRHE